MELSLFTSDGFQVLLRWFHVFFGIIWIGHLYYLNFVHGAFMNEIDAPGKTLTASKLLPRAMWWFRYGALFTWIFGLVFLMYRGHLLGFEAFSTSWGVTILTGSFIGTLMFLNVWLVIWPRQKRIIANAVNVAAGQPADASIAPLGPRALVASRTNVLFSIPMLFFMVSARHLPLAVGMDSNFLACTLVLLVILGALELNALKGKLGPLTTVKGVIHMGFALTAVLYAVMEIFL